MNTQKIRAGVVGAGLRFAHIRELMSRPESPFTLRAVADTSGPARTAVRTAQPDLHVYSDYRELANDADVDAVFVLAPDFLHGDIGMASLQAGKATFIAHDADDLFRDAVRQLIGIRVGGKQSGTGTRPAP